MSILVSRLRPGDDVELAVNMANAHIFDPKTETHFLTKVFRFIEDHPRCADMHLM